MKILLYSIHHAPELTGIGKYNGELSAWLAGQGHEVTVVTAFPYYPNWKIQAPYTGRWWKKEKRSERETVVRCPLYVPRRLSAFQRVLQEFSFLLSSSLAFLAVLFQPFDVVICVVTPFHLGVPARLFSWLKGIPMVYHVQDLQIDAAGDLDLMKNKALLSMMKALEKWILNRTDLVSTISEGMIRKIEAKGIPGKKITFFPNWVDTDFIYPLPRSKSLREKFGFLPSDRLVLYAGNLGEKQGLEMIVEVARRLRTTPRLFFVMVGEGGAKNRLQQLADKDQLPNIRFFPLQDYDRLAALLAMADLHLVLQKKAASDLVMPSKLSTILAAGGCALITAEEGSALHEIARRHQLGILIQPEDTRSLQEGILEALSSDLSIYEQNARMYAERFLHKEKVLKTFEQELIRLISPL